MRLYLVLLIFVPSFTLAECIDVVDPMRPALFSIAQGCGNINTQESTFTFVNPPSLPIYTAAQINTYSLVKPGMIVGCSACTNCYVCVGTGSVAGQVACDVAPKGTPCR